MADKNRRLNLDPSFICDVCKKASKTLKRTGLNMWVCEKCASA